MPSATYMVVDPRRDHAIRVPRPDLSVKYGTPNACTDCHTDRDARWAAARVAAWYDATPTPDVRAYVAAAFGAASASTPEVQAQLRALVEDRSVPSITRASALAVLDPASLRSARETFSRSLYDPSPLVRLGALQSAARLPAEVRAPLVAPLLSDPLRTIRSEAANILAGAPAEALDFAQQAAQRKAADEFIESLRYNADRADARVQLGSFLAQQGNGPSAESQLRAALEIDSMFLPAYVNLADLYRMQERDADGERLLRAGLALAPRSAALRHALGLTLVRMRRLAEAVNELGRAATLDPADVRFSYVYAVALHSTGKADAAIARLEKTLSVDSTNTDVLAALVSFHRERGESAAAERYAVRLRVLTGRR
jgi:Tfp pilus assembly protein PilF